jgi:hypothetical protein
VRVFNVVFVGCKPIGGCWGACDDACLSHLGATPRLGYLVTDGKSAAALCVACNVHQ